MIRLIKSLCIIGLFSTLIAHTTTHTASSKIKKRNVAARKVIVELHKPTLWQTFKKNAGNVFSFALPALLTFKPAYSASYAALNEPPSAWRRRAATTLDDYATLNRHGLMRRSRANAGTSVVVERNYQTHATSTKTITNNESADYTHACNDVLRARRIQRMDDTSLIAHIQHHAHYDAIRNGVMVSLVAGLIGTYLYNCYLDYKRKNGAATRAQK